MVEFETYMSVALSKCAPSGEGTGEERQAVFQDFVAEWNRKKETIKDMTEAELQRSIECP